MTSAWKMVEIFPSKLQKLWNSIELRVLVLLSLFLQIVLIATGNRRKYTRNRWIAIILWLSYLSADAVATLALGVLSQTQGDARSPLDPAYTLMAFWAPFLLMHLGGPDTITAYALADNELWSRHLLGLIGQVGVAVYVFLRSFSGKHVNYLWMVIFVSGLVKYGERTRALYLASRDKFRDSMVSRPDPGPNYAKLMDEWVCRVNEGYDVSLKKEIATRESSSSSSSPVVVNPAADFSYTGEGAPEMVVLHEAYYFYGTFKRLFADLILSFQDRETSLSFFKTLDWDRAFEIVEAELGLIYDLFYTKAFIIHSPLGLFLRILTFSSTIAAFAAFLIIDKKEYPKTEVIITHFLLVGAILLELYAVMIFLSSDRTMIWLSDDWIGRPGLRTLRDPIVSAIFKISSQFRYLHILPARKRWSNAMGQYNLLDSCLKSKPLCNKAHQYLKQYLFWGTISIPQGLKALIFDELRFRANYSNDDEESQKKSGVYRSDNILLREMDSFVEFDDVEFDQSILLWHIATDFCYHTENGDNPEDIKNGDNPENIKEWPYKFIIDNKSSPADILKFKREMSRFLSDYMVHLLMMSPFMLPSGIGQIRFQDTCAEAIEFLENQRLQSKRYACMKLLEDTIGFFNNQRSNQRLSSKGDACKKILEVDVRVSPSEVKGDRSKSLLFDACRLVDDLNKLKFDERWGKINQAWLDIITFAAAQCRWNDHAEKLSQGGELLTHVWLLMAHFGMTDQFQISQGYVRAKLELK